LIGKFFSRGLEGYQRGPRGIGGFWVTADELEMCIYFGVYRDGYEKIGAKGAV